MQPRQLIAVLVAFIVILGAAVFVVTWTGGDDDDTEASADPTSTTTGSTSTTSTTTSTTTTSIPTRCTLDAPVDETEPDATDGSETDEDDGSDETPADDSDDPPIVPTLGPNSSISTVGLDTVNFGMTVFQAEQAAGTTMIPCELVSECYRVTPVDAPEGISFVVHDGTIERVDIANGPITTKSGIGIGSSEARIVELFGDQLEHEVIDDSTTELVFVPADEDDAEFRVIFTISDGVVETFRSGRIPLVLSQTACAST